MTREEKIKFILDTVKLEKYECDVELISNEFIDKLERAYWADSFTQCQDEALEIRKKFKKDLLDLGVNEESVLEVLNQDWSKV